MMKRGRKGQLPRERKDDQPAAGREDTMTYILVSTQKITIDHLCMIYIGRGGGCGDQGSEGGWTRNSGVSGAAHVVVVISYRKFQFAMTVGESGSLVSGKTWECVLLTK